MPSLNALRAFETVARHLSYVEASKELGVTPAAVKHLVRKLEDALGASLVVRAGRGVALTDIGRACIPELSSGFRQISRAVHKVRNTNARSTLTITAEPSFAANWLLRRIDKYKMANPDVDVLIDSSMRVVDLEQANVDVALRYCVKPTGTQIVHRLYDEETLPVCSPALAKGPPALNELSDLARVELIHMDINGSEWTTMATKLFFDWEGWLDIVEAKPFPLSKGLRFTDYNLAVQAAIAGKGVVLGSWPVVMDAVQAGLLVAPFNERGKSSMGYDLVVTKDGMKKPEVAAFVEWVLNELIR